MIFPKLVVPAAAIVVPAQASVVSAETSIVPVDIVVISTEATVTPVDNSSTTPAPAAPGYFALLLEQLKNFFVAEPTNSTVAEPSAPIVEQVVLA